MSAMAAKRRRHRAILELIGERSIGSQEALRSALERLGHSVTQSTLSRDLRELRIVRVPERRGYRYALARVPDQSPEAEEREPAGVLPGEVVGVEANEVTVVLRTRVGRAQGVAVHLDRNRPPGVLATLAGDDTVLVIPRSTREVESLVERLSGLFEIDRAPRAAG